VVVGARTFSAPFAVRGIAVERPVEKLRHDCTALANATAALIGLNARFSQEEIAIDDGYVGPAYGVATEDGLAAIRLLAQTEGVFLDPVYSGKAMAGMLADIRAGAMRADEAVIFLHTGGGPSLFPFGTALLAPPNV
jgi:1-aminocyclopropane-1-carboxylate deaminase/D-cysteine desulfhydrase-like pyridoxal-dependent ACC family enzyme